MIMNKKIRISVLAALFSFASVFVNNVKADDEIWYEPQAPEVSIVKDGKDINSNTFIGLTASVHSINAYILDKYKNVESEVPSVCFGEGSSAFIMYETSGGTIKPSTSGLGVESTNAKLKTLKVQEGNTPTDYAGKTMKIQILMGKKSPYTVFDYYVEVLGAPTLVKDGDNYYFDEGNVAYIGHVCEGDVVAFSIGNSKYPLGSTSKSVSGYVYEAIYSWDLRINTSTTKNYAVDTKSIYADNLTTGASQLYEFVPTVVYKYNNGIKSGVTGSIEKDTIIAFQYDSQVEIENKLNGVSTNAITICNGDGVDISSTIYKDGLDLYEGTVSLYLLDSGVEDLIETQTAEDLALGSGFSILQGELTSASKELLTIKDGQNTVYNFRIKVHDTSYTYCAYADCYAQKDFSVTVLENNADITFDVIPAEVCANTNIDITASHNGKSNATDYSYEWSCDEGSINPDAKGLTDGSGSGKISSLTDQAVSFGSGVRTYTLTVSNQGCKTSKSQSVVVNKLPEITNDGDQTICLGQEATLSVSNVAGLTYNWDTYPTGGALEGLPNANTLTDVSPAAAGVKMYQVTAQDNTTYCVTAFPTIVKLTVNPLPDIASVSASPSAICVGEKTIVTATLADPLHASPITYTWTLTDADGSTTQTTTVNYIQIEPTKTTQVEVTAKDENMCDCSTTGVYTIVTVNNLPEFNATSEPSCDGADIIISLYAEGGATLSYTVTPVDPLNTPAGTLVGDVYTVKYPAKGITSQTTYQYKIVANDGTCSNEKTIDVSVNPLPDFKEVKADPAVLCLGESVKLTASSNMSGLTYSWSNGSAGASVTDTPTAAGIITYTVTATNTTTGCENTATVDVDVRALPTTTISGDNPICVGESTTLKADADGMTYKWSNGQETQSISVSPTVTTDYWVIVNDGTCTSEQIPVTLVVNSLPEFTVTATPDAVCPNESTTVTFTCTVTNGVTVTDYVWEDASISKVSDGVYQITKAWNVAETFKVTAQSSCGTKDQTVTVNIHKKLEINAVANPAIVCKDAGTEVKLKASAVNGETDVTYEWFDATMTSIGTGATISVTPNVTTTYTVRALNNLTGCAPVEQTVEVTVNELPVVTITPSATTICEGESVTLDAPEGFTYKWQYESTTKTTQSITVTPASTTDYILIVSDKTTAACQSLPVTQTIVVNPKPQFTLSAVESEVCVGTTQTVIITPTITNGVALDATVLFSWNSADVIPVGDGTYQVNKTWNTTTTYEATALSSVGCSSDAVTVTITVNPAPVLNEPVATPSAICEGSGDAVQLSASVASGSNIEYEWFIGSVSLGTGATITVTPNATTTYTVYATDKTSPTNCKSEGKDVVVTITPLPLKAEVSASATEVCANSSSIDLSIVSPQTGVTYSWYTSDDVYIADGTTINVAPSTTTSYYSIGKTTCEGPKSDIVTITVYENPDLVPTISTMVTGCQYSETYLSVSSSETGLTYIWRKNGADYSTGVDQTNVAITLDNATDTYTVIVVDESTTSKCESDPVTFTAIGTAAPSVDFTVVHSDVCDGDNVTVTVNSDAFPNATIDWSYKDASDILYPISGSADVNTFSVSKDNTYWVGILSMDSWCFTEKQIPLTIGEQPQFTILGNVEDYCQGQDLNLSLDFTTNESDVIAYHWMFNGTEISATNTLSILNLSTDNSGTYTIDVETATCTQSQTFTVNVTDKPKAVIVAPDNICLGSTVDISSATSGIAYSWQINGADYSTDESFIYDASSLVAGSKIDVSFVFTGAAGCVSEPETKQITILPEFTASLSSANTQLAPNQNVTYEVSSASQDIVEYYVLENGIEVASNTISATDNFTFEYTSSLTSDFELAVKLVSADGCEYTTTPLSIEVSGLNIDDITTSTGNLSVCIDNTLDIIVTASGAIADNYQYKYFVDGVEMSTSSSNKYTFTPTVEGSALITIEVTDVDAGYTVSQDVTIVVNNLPDALLTFVNTETTPGYYSLCSSELLEFSFNATKFALTVDGNDFGIYDYDGTTWNNSIIVSSTFEKFFNSISVSGSTANVTISYADNKTHVVDVTAINVSTGCYATTETFTYKFNSDIEINVDAPHTIVADKLTMIQGAAAVLTPTSADATSYTVLIGGVEVATGVTSYTFDGIEYGNYTLTFIDNNGCEEYLDIEVLEGVEQKHVSVSSEYYCDSSTGVSIWVEDPQAGVTYKLVGCSSCSPIVCDGSSVQWDNVRIEGSNPSVYSVIGYHNILPSESKDMLDVITITEVPTPEQYRLLPYNAVVYSCDAEQLTLENSQTNVFYYVYLDDTQILGPIEGVDGELPLCTADAIGKYTVRAYSKYLTENVCEVIMDGIYTIDLPKANQYTIVSSPSNGNYCASDAGVDLSLSSSDAGVFYYLMKNGAFVMVGSDSLKVEGTGSTIDFGYQTDEGMYTIVTLINGCQSYMLGSVNVTRYELPLHQTISIDNEGHFCEGDEGAIITIGGQEEGYVYTLYCNDVNTGLTYTGDNSGSSFTFGPMTFEGSLEVKATIPSIENGCEAVVTDKVEAIMDKLPAEIVMLIGDNVENDTICETEFTTISLFGVEKDVIYQLYRDGSYVDEQTMLTTSGYMTFENIDQAGTYTLKAMRSILLPSSATYACPKDLASQVTLVVLPRPATGLEVLGQETPTTTDPCYGEDIFVENAQPGFEYRLYKVDETDNIYSAPSQVFIAVGDASVDRFTDIKDKSGTYRIYVSNFYCEDVLTPDISIHNDKFVVVQKVIADKQMCQGDLGKYVSLGAAEPDVMYTLYGPKGNVVDTYNSISTDGFTFANPIFSQGKYYVEGIRIVGTDNCPTPMAPEINFRVNNLPVSFELVGQSHYCGASVGAQLGLSGSEIGVTYSLYSVGSDESLELVETVVGTGNELEFPTLVPEGVYIAAARNGSTECTSSMKGRIEVVYSAEIPVLGIDMDLVSCGANAPFVLDASTLMVGATYYLESGSNTPSYVEPLQSKTFDGTSNVEFTIPEEGEYTIWASFDDYACISYMGSVTLIYDKLTEYEVTIDNNCSLNSVVRIKGSDIGVKYIMNGEEQIGNGLALEWPVSGEGMQTFEVIADNGACTQSMGIVSINFVPEIINLEIDDVVKTCDTNVEYTLDETKLVPNVTYYLVSGISTPDATNIVSSFMFDGISNIKFSLPTEGIYSIWASYDSNYCMTLMGKVELSYNIFKQYELSSELACSDIGSVVLDGSEFGVNYILGTDTIEGTGGPIVWSVKGTGKTTFEVFADNGICKGSLGTTTIDFSKYIEPIANIDLYIERELYVGKDTAEFCASSAVQFITNVENVTVKQYKYYLNGEEWRTSTNSMLIPTFDGMEGKFTLSVSITTINGCEFDSIASISFNVLDGQLPGIRLVAENNYPEYCEGEDGVRICFLNAIKDCTYRLYKVSEDPSSPNDDLIDIQELPWYSTETSIDSLWFKGWGSSSTKENNANATEGSYYVEVDELNGCTSRSNVLHITMNPLPVDSSNSVYYAYVNDDMSIDEGTISDEYGLLDAGYLIYEGAKVGVTYQLMHEENGAILQTRKAEANGQRLFFGPVSSIPDTIDANSPESLWGEGAYTIIATNDTTGCSTQIGYIDFVQEQLTAYDVYLYLNKSQSSVRQELIPRYPNKGNQKYIGWSSKVDLAFSPQLSEDGMSDITDGVELYEKGSGYTSIMDKSNIVFELVPEVVLKPDTMYCAKENATDSVYVSTSYKYYITQQLVDTLNNVQSDTTIWYNTYVEGCDSIGTDIYSYFNVTKPEPAKKKYGSVGFYNYLNKEVLDTLRSNTGVFVFNRAPNFYGVQTYTYYIYNKKLKNVRRSNTATITVLCGNEMAPDSSYFLLPNAFSPNGDGLNDVYKVLLPSQYANSESKLEVFNRWGTLVYRSSGIRYGEDESWWDGTSKSSNMLTVGEKLPSGTYFYVFTITFNSGNDDGFITRKFNGYIELRR